MSTATMSDSYLNPLRLSDTAASEVGRSLNRFEGQISEDASNVFTISGYKERAVHELQEIYASTAVVDWDGCGAKAISADVIYEAENFIKALPGRIPMPEFSPTPDGDISLEWYRSQNRNFSIILEGTNTLIFSSRFGHNDRTYGRRPFNDVIPKFIIEQISKIRN